MRPERRPTAAPYTTRALTGRVSAPSGSGLGPDLVTNGNFATDASWTKGTGWTIAGGKATHAAGSLASLSQSIGLVAGLTYQVTFTVTDYAAGALSAYIGVSAVPFTVSSVGVKNADRVAAGDAVLYFQSDVPGDLSIDNVTVRQVT